VSERDVKYKWIARINRDVGNATAHDRGTDRSRLETFEEHIAQLRRT
jgi:hypothetical protein